jgi:acetate kinase
MTSRVLVVNAGSSSLKFKLFDLELGELLPCVSGVLERIGDAANSSITLKVSFFSTA